MSTALIKKEYIVDDILAYTNEHCLYFPCFSYNTNCNTGSCNSFFRENRGFQEEDISYVPSLYNIKLRLNYNSTSSNNICLGSNKFVERFLTATNIFIIDTHIDKSFFKYIEHVLTKNFNCDIRKIEIISSQLDSSEHFDNVLKVMRNKQISFRIYTGLEKDIIHDCFVLFDDELWHFGGTIGGIQKGLTAYSTGWYGYDLENLLYELKNEYHLKEYPNE